MNDFNELIKKINKKNFIGRFLLFNAALFLSAIVLNLLTRPSKIVTGGAAGISIILEYLFDIDPSQSIFVISIVTFFLSLIFLDKDKYLGALIASFTFPFFVKLTSNIGSYIPIDFSELLLIAIFIGVLEGIVTGLIFKSGFSAGGVSTFFYILYKYFKISLNTSNLLINSVLVFTGGFLFGWSRVLYSIIVIYISSRVSDRVLLGISQNKTIMIMTSKEPEVKKYIVEDLHCGLTEINVKGGFISKKRDLLMTIVSNRDYFKLKNGIKLIDKDAFLIITDSYEVSKKRTN